MKTILLIIIILIFSINTTKAQLQGQVLIDSLLKELPKMKEDTNGVNLLNKLSFAYYIINPDKGIEYGLNALELSKELNWDLGVAKSYNSLAVNYIAGKSDFSKSLEYFLKSLKFYEKLNDKVGSAKLNGNIGNIFSNMNKSNKALKYYIKALELGKELDDDYLIKINLENIGTTYATNLDYIKAIEFLEKALVYSINKDDNLSQARIYGSLATVYKSLKEYSISLDYFDKSLRINEKLGNKSGIANNLGNKGGLLLSIVEDEGSDLKINEINIIDLSNVKLTESISYSKEAIEIAKEIGEINYQQIFLVNLSKAYELKGEFKKAYDTYKVHKKLKDSIFSSENQTTIAKLEAKRENELKEKEIVILKKEKENEKLQRYAMFGGIAGLGIIIGLILIQRRKSEKLLLNVLPAKIAKRLKAKEHPIADHFDGASIMFVDIVGFTSLSSDADPKRVVSVLNDIFTIFDKLADKHGLEKIKTIGDAYMAVAGIPEIQSDHAKRTAQMALDIKSEMKDFKTSDGTEIKFRIGIDCGAVVAGVIGEKKFIYDLWSDAVNTASRMESTGESGQIQITDNFKTELEKFEGGWNFTLRGEFEIKGKGNMKTYYLGN